VCVIGRQNPGKVQAGNVPEMGGDRYIVLNSGHTFGEKEFRGTNALLFPRLGDYAVLKRDGTVVLAGLFGENWELTSGTN
jgi:hypothetical protein